MSSKFLNKADPLMAKLHGAGGDPAAPAAAAAPALDPIGSTSGDADAALREGRRTAGGSAAGVSPLTGSSTLGNPRRRAARELLG
jgi:hypothetical protein